jgi:DNA-binding HxlR family transcriptional regulator
MVSSCNQIRYSRPMSRKRFTDMNCGIAQTLEVLGDWWTLLIVRDAFFGVRRFSDFQANLGIARNILAARLRQLVGHGILARVEAGIVGTRHEYRLTDKGEALLPVLMALRDWSDRWVFGPGREPVLTLARASGRRVPRVAVLDADGQPLARRDLRTVPGPGATPETRAMLQAAPPSAHSPTR